jgi:hypothetical protein
MDAIAIILTALVLGTIVLSPFFGAEDRPDFLRPDRKHRGWLSPLRQR